MENYIIGIGELLWDILPNGKKIGGAPVNFAYHISQFGLPGFAVSAVGKDDSGSEITEVLKEKDIKGLIYKVNFPTGTVSVTIDNLGIPLYSITENVAWDNIPYTPELKQLAVNTTAVCFGSLAQRSAVSRQTITHFLDDVLANNSALVVFDINLRQGFYTQEIIDESLKRCNILKINDEELAVVSHIFGYTGTDMIDKCKQLLEDYSLKLVILTCGVNGSYVITPEKTYFRPTPKVEVADTVGAGDSFTAAFIAALLRGKSIEEAHSTAVRTSAFVCSQNGAMPVLPQNITI